MKGIKPWWSVGGLVTALIALMLFSAASGEIHVPLKEVIPGIMVFSSNYNNSLIQNLRLPRILAGAAIGAALSVSGLLSSTALRNPLADSGILGIQSGATVGALIALLVLPGMVTYMPLMAFWGGVIAFSILLLLSRSARGSFQPERIVLLGVAINSVGTSIIGVITIMNVYKLRDAMSWLSGSLTSVNTSQMSIILVYTGLFLIGAFFLSPVLKLLLLEDSHIINLGYSPVFLRVLVSLFAVMLASISVAFAGIISFIGIIAPQLGRKILGQDFRYLIAGSAVIGALLVVATDLFQKMVFAPREIPVGILIGVLGAPLFIALAREGRH